MPILGELTRMALVEKSQTRLAGAGLAASVLPANARKCLGAIRRELIQTSRIPDANDHPAVQIESCHATIQGGSTCISKTSFGKTVGWTFNQNIKSIRKQKAHSQEYAILKN